MNRRGRTPQKNISSSLIATSHSFFGYLTHFIVASRDRDEPTTTCVESNGEEESI